MGMLGTTLQIIKRDRPWVDKSILRTKFTHSLMATIREISKRAYKGYRVWPGFEVINSS